MCLLGSPLTLKFTIFPIIRVIMDVSGTLRRMFAFDVFVIACLDFDAFMVCLSLVNVDLFVS